MTHRKRHRRIKLRSLYNWHRYLGLLAAFFVLVLAITGIMLNHTEDMALDEQHVRSGWLLDWYGVEPPRQFVAFRVGERWVTQAEDRLFIDSRMARAVSTDERDSLVGALQTGDLLIVALRGSLLLYTPEGEFIEHLGDTHGVPAGMARIGQTRDGTICIEGAHGLYATDTEFSDWRHHDCRGVRWVEPAPVPDELATRIQRTYRGTQITWERVTLDLHSGRLFGNTGVLVMDLAAILFAFLAISGILLWTIRLIKQRRHRRHGRKTP